MYETIRNSNPPSKRSTRVGFTPSFSSPRVCVLLAACAPLDRERWLRRITRVSSVSTYAQYAAPETAAFLPDSFLSLSLFLIIPFERSSILFLRPLQVDLNRDGYYDDDSHAKWMDSKSFPLCLASYSDRKIPTCRSYQRAIYRFIYRYHF